MMDLPEQICRVGVTMFARRLTDIAGGNISARYGDTIYLSPRYAGQRYHWQLTPDLIVSGRWADDEITKDPRFSREGWAHLNIYRHYPEVQVVIHAHPFHVMPFAAFSRPIEPVLEAQTCIGTVPVCAPAPSHSVALAENIIAALRGQEERFHELGAAVLIPMHGIILAGVDFDRTLDALERIEVNAYCLTTRSLLG